MDNSQPCQIPLGTREAAQRRSDQRHINYVGANIASVPDLFSAEPSTALPVLLP